MKKKSVLLILLAVITMGSLCNTAEAQILGPGRIAPLAEYRLVKTYPHDLQAFTQGLVYYFGDFYESTGLYGHSDLRRVDIQTGEVLQRTEVSKRYFAEGITIWGDTIVQLTWKAGIAFFYNRKTFERTTQRRYIGRGWGLTDNGYSLIMSNGSSTLTFRNGVSLEPEREIQVKDGVIPINKLNELEYAEGKIYANVYGEERIAVIRPEDGKVLAWVDLTEMVAPVLRLPRVKEMNGIAYNPETGTFYITGKKWPVVYELEIILPQEEEVLEEQDVQRRLRETAPR